MLRAAAGSHQTSHTDVGRSSVGDGANLNYRHLQASAVTFLLQID
jgi:hypothetical protein